MNNIHSLPETIANMEIAWRISTEYFSDSGNINLTTVYSAPFRVSLYSYGLQTQKRRLAATLETKTPKKFCPIEDVFGDTAAVSTNSYSLFSLLKCCVIIFYKFR
jgi:hypothetical protein